MTRHPRNGKVKSSFGVIARLLVRLKCYVFEATETYEFDIFLNRCSNIGWPVNNHMCVGIRCKNVCQAGDSIMPWNYRACKRVINGEVCITIHESYYDDRNSAENGDPHSITRDPIEAFGAGETDQEALDEIRFALKAMLKALDKPVLDYSKF